MHTPEYAFEHVPSNVAAGVRRLGLTFPVALDNSRHRPPELLRAGRHLDRRQPAQVGTVTIALSPGLAAYSFTFG